MKKPQGVPEFLQALRKTVEKFGYVVLDAKTVRQFYGVGKSGNRVSPAIERDLRSRGYCVRRLDWEKEYTQLDLILISGVELSAEQLERVSADAWALWAMPVDDRGFFWWHRHGDDLVKRSPHLEPTRWFSRTLWPVHDDEKSGDKRGRNPALP